MPWTRLCQTDFTTLHDELSHLPCHCHWRHRATGIVSSPGIRKDQEPQLVTLSRREKAYHSPVFLELRFLHEGFDQSTCGDLLIIHSIYNLLHLPRRDLFQLFQHRQGKSRKRVKVPDCNMRWTDGLLRQTPFPTQTKTPTTSHKPFNLLLLLLLVISKLFSI